MLKDLSSATFISIATLVILFGYIVYQEGRQGPVAPAVEEVISDEGVIETGADDLMRVPAVSFDVPEKMTFADEPVPLAIPDVRERLDKELQINCYLHSNTIFLIKRAHRWLPQMEKILKKYNIPEDFKYLPLIENKNSFDPG